MIIDDINNAIDYVEQNVTNTLDYVQVAQRAYLSVFYFQRVFSAMCGCTLGEYVRGRRMYLSATEILSGSKVTDVAFKYGYDSVEGFSRAFSRFHGVTPGKLTQSSIRYYPRLQLTNNLSQGDCNMDYKIEKNNEFTVIGFCRKFDGATSMREIPKFWDEINSRFGAVAYCGQAPSTPMEQAFVDNCIGEYGVCIDDEPNGQSFHYMIAGLYRGGVVPQGMQLHTIPAKTWAKFSCIGKMPDSLQSLTTQVYRDWLPTNGKYEMDGMYTLEWYSSGDTQSDDYRSEIWICVKQR